MTKEQAKAICQDNIHVIVPENEDGLCVLEVKADPKLTSNVIALIVDRYFALALIELINYKE